MTIRECIIQKIEAEKILPNPVADTSDLYGDLGFDSLSFICLLLEVEEEYHVAFGIDEMEKCVRVGYLVSSVENKVKEREEGDVQRLLADW